MKRIINIHADDFGTSDEITDGIIDSINDGLVNSISIITTTESYINSMNKLKNVNDDVRLNLHINLIEGYPCTPKSEIPDIVNQSGEFKYTFLALWIKYLTSSRKEKEKITNQIRTEIECQINKYRDHITDEVPLRIDSHMHFHMIPFIFDILLELSNRYNIKFIRIPYELRYYNSATNKNYISSNIIKNVLLNSLARFKSEKLKESNIGRNDYFIGVLATGNITLPDLNSALKAISTKGNPKSVDILFHPGGIKDVKSITWTNKKMFLDYYTSINRKQERHLLKNKETKKTILHYETLFNN